MVVCPKCEGDDLELAKRLEGTARIIRCLNCGHEWQRGELPMKTLPGSTTEQRVRARFPTAHDVPGQRLAALDRLAASFEPDVPPEEAESVHRYQAVFGAERLPRMTTEEFQEFYRSKMVGFLGNAVWVLDQNYNAMDAEDYTSQIREAIGYLLYEERGSLESRLTDLIRSRGRIGVRGLKETVLTKVLAVMYPDSIFPFATYDSASEASARLPARSWASNCLPRTAWTGPSDD